MKKLMLTILGIALSMVPSIAFAQAKPVLNAKFESVTVPAVPFMAFSVKPKGITTHYMLLTFTSPSDAIATTTYNFYRGNAPGGEGTTPVVTGLPNAPWQDNTADVVGQQYCYKMTATTGGVESAQSNESCATILPFAPVLTGAAPH